MNRRGSAYGGPGRMGGPGYGGPGYGEPGGPPPRGFRRFFHGEGGGCIGNCATYLILAVIVIAVTFFLFLGMLTEPADDSGSTSASLYAREKLELDITYDDNCVIDELGWIEDADMLAGDLQYFYEETGIQPYIYLKAYDETLSNDGEKLSYAEEWYEEHIDNEGTFLFVYYAEENTDEDVGYMCYVCGSDITSVMDDDAIEVFWDTLDTYWYSDLDTDDMFAVIYEETADSIMSAAVISGTTDGTGRVAAAFIAVILAAALLIVVNRLRGKSTY